MNHKKQVYIGIAVLASSIIIGTLGTVWGIFNSFEGLKVTETAGIGAVGSGIKSAILFTLFSIIGTIFGSILIISGIVKSRKIESLN